VLYVVAYDIPNDRRRNRVLALLRGYGVSVQLSLVECDLPRERFQELRRRLEELVHPRLDQVSVYALCGRRQGVVERLGPPPGTDLSDL
jgi:CRISPR-associated protein Cas2